MTTSRKRTTLTLPGWTCTLLPACVVLASSAHPDSHRKNVHSYDSHCCLAPGCSNATRIYPRHTPNPVFLSRLVSCFVHCSVQDLRCIVHCSQFQDFRGTRTAEAAGDSNPRPSWTGRRGKELARRREDRREKRRPPHPSRVGLTANSPQRAAVLTSPELAETFPNLYHRRESGRENRSYYAKQLQNF